MRDYLAIVIGFVGKQAEDFVACIMIKGVHRSLSHLYLIRCKFAQKLLVTGE